MQRELTAAIAESGVHLSFRARVLLLLIFDALQDEPLRGLGGTKDEAEARDTLRDDVGRYLPDLLRSLQASLDNVDHLRTITVFDILHNFEKIIGGVPRNQFFPGKL